MAESLKILGVSVVAAVLYGVACASEFLHDRLLRTDLRRQELRDN